MAGLLMDDAIVIAEMLTSVGELTATSRQKTMTITHTHGRAEDAQKCYRRIQRFFDDLKVNAPQLRELERCCRILSETIKKILGQRVLGPPKQALTMG